MIENDHPELTARIDIALFTLVVFLKQHQPDNFARDLREHVQTWRDFLVQSKVSDEYLSALDVRLDSMLDMIRKK